MERGEPMKSLDKFYPEGWMLYCSRGHYVKQSEPQSFSGGKTVVIDNDFGECPECDKEVQEAQSILGRLGLPKENQQ
jgi:hypothetical protein